MEGEQNPNHIPTENMHSSTLAKELYEMGFT